MLYIYIYIQFLDHCKNQVATPKTPSVHKSNSFFVWRSLLAARDIIYNGSKWRVGDGITVGVYSHKWLTHTPISLNEQATDMQVETMFAQRTQQETLAIPLDHLHSLDTLIQIENKAKKFIVKMAYRIALRLSTQPWAKHSSSHEFQPAWNKIQAHNVPLKFRLFIWKACSNCLPTKDNLHRRRERVDTKCEFCHHQSENTSHILWECPFAQNMWALMSSRIQKCGNNAEDFFHLFRQLYKKLS